MSNQKSTYLKSRIERGCPPGHSKISSWDNLAGRIIDTHKMPFMESEWPGMHNSDMHVMADRIVALEDKTGLLGWNGAAPDYTLVPKTGVLPSYDTDASSGTVTINKNELPTTHTIGNTLHFINQGRTHDDSIHVLARALKELEMLCSAGEITPKTPNTYGNVHKNSIYANTREDGKLVGDLSVKLPWTYNTVDSVAEGIAKLDHKLSQIHKVKLNDHVDNSYDDAANWTNTFLDADALWDSEFLQKQIQRIIEDVGMDRSRVDKNPSLVDYDYANFASMLLWERSVNHYAINSTTIVNGEGIVTTGPAPGPVVQFSKEYIKNIGTVEVYVSNHTLGSMVQLIEGTDFQQDPLIVGGQNANKITLLNTYAAVQGKITLKYFRAAGLPNFNTHPEIVVNPTSQKNYKVWSAERSTYTINLVAKKARTALVKAVEVLLPAIRNTTNALGVGVNASLYTDDTIISHLVDGDPL